VKLAIEADATLSRRRLVLGLLPVKRTRDPIPAEIEPQRVPFISERLRPDSLCQYQTGV
jgi:hypothetical protein